MGNTGKDQVINADDRSLKKVLGQKQPAIVVLYDATQKDKPLQDTLGRTAKKHNDELLVIVVDAQSNPDAHARYDHPQLPALVTLTPAFFGRKVKSSAQQVRPADIRAHVDHLLNDVPLPTEKPSDTSNNKKARKATHSTDRTFQKDVLKSKQPVLVDFWAPWCGPCRNVAPFVDQLAQDYAGKVRVIKVNVDENKGIAGKYHIQSIPTFMVFESGQPINRLSGASPNAIKQMVEDALIE